MKAGGKNKILVAYNSPRQDRREDPSFISESEVEDLARLVSGTLSSAGFDSELFPVCEIRKDLKKIISVSPSLIFNLCEGYQGESRFEMNIAAVWELLGIPFTGNSSRTLALSQDKAVAKSIFESRNIPTPAWEICPECPSETSLRYPLIAKPSREDASLGIGTDPLVRNLDELKIKVSELLAKFDEPVLLEEFIDGREFNVAIRDDGSGPRALPVSEIDFSALDDSSPRVTSYEAKWLEEHPVYMKTPSVCPAKIDAELAGRLQDISLRVFKSLEGKDYGRVDLRMDGEGRIYVLEYNPNPAIAPDAGFHKSLLAEGVGFGDFLSDLVRKNFPPFKKTGENLP